MIEWKDFSVEKPKMGLEMLIRIAHKSGANIFYLSKIRRQFDTDKRYNPDFYEFEYPDNHWKFLPTGDDPIVHWYELKYAEWLITPKETSPLKDRESNDSKVVLTVNCL